MKLLLGEMVSFQERNSSCLVTIQSAGCRAGPAWVMAICVWEPMIWHLRPPPLALSGLRDVIYVGSFRDNMLSTYYSFMFLTYFSYPQVFLRFHTMFTFNFYVFLASNKPLEFHKHQMIHSQRSTFKVFFVLLLLPLFLIIPTEEYEITF